MVAKMVRCKSCRLLMWDSSRWFPYCSLKCKRVTLRCPDRVERGKYGGENDNQAGRL